MATVHVKFDTEASGFAAEPKLLARAALRAARKAGATAQRDMRSEASKRIRARKRIKPKYVRRAIALKRTKGSTLAALSWTVELDGAPVPLIAYPVRQTRRGVVAEVNRGKRTLIPGAFISTMRSGHRGVFRRVGKDRLPIRELRGSRPVDALLHKGEAEGVAERGASSFRARFVALLPLEAERA